MAEPCHAVWPTMDRGWPPCGHPMADDGPSPQHGGACYLQSRAPQFHSLALTLSLSTTLYRPHRGTAERHRATEQLHHRLAPAPPCHCRLHLIASFAVFPSTSSTWLQHRSSYDEGEITILVLASELDFHGHLHGELAAAWLACALLLIPRVRAWSGCSLASSMTLLRLVAPPAWNTMRSAAALSPPRHRARG